MSSEVPLKGLGRKIWTIQTESGGHQRLHCKKEEKLAKDSGEKAKGEMQKEAGEGTVLLEEMSDPSH